MEPVISAPETVVGASLKVDGDLKSQGDMRIEGKVHGSIQTDGTVSIGQGAEVTANITAANAEIAGQVEGDIKVKDRLSLTESARVKGNLTSQELVIAQGAVFSGTSAMPDPNQSLAPNQSREPLLDTDISLGSNKKVDAKV